MIPRDVFYDRLEKHCKPCSEWDGVCLRGHALQSPTGCPMLKFEPIQAADYDPDHGRTVGPRSASGGARISLRIATRPMRRGDKRSRGRSAAAG